MTSVENPVNSKYFPENGVEVSSLQGMKETFAERLKRLLNEKHYGKSETAWARESGVDFKTLRRALEGEGTPRHPTVQRLADYCGVSVEYMMTGEGLPQPAAADIDAINEKVREAMGLLEEIQRDLGAQSGDGKP